MMNPFPKSSPAERILAEIRPVLPRLGLVANRPRSCPALGVFFLGAAFLSACTQISLRQAMDQVQRKYVLLMDEFELGSNFGVRDAAKELSQALEAPEITIGSSPAQDAEFQHLLQDTVDTTRRIQTEATRFDSNALAKMRSEISSRCQACHEKFKPPDEQ